MAQFDTGSIVVQNGGLTNGREIGAYAIAQVIKLALTYAVGFSGLLSPLYMAAYKIGGSLGVVPVTLVINVIWGGVALLLFLALRAALGGVPAVVAGPGRESAFTSRAGEIGAFVIAYLILVVIVLVLHSAFLAPIYAELGRNGQRQVIMTIGLAISVANAVLVYPIFIGLRSALCR